MTLFKYHEWLDESPVRTVCAIVAEMVVFVLTTLMVLELFFPHGVAHEPWFACMQTMVGWFMGRFMTKFLLPEQINRLGVAIRAGIGFIAACIIFTQLPSLSGLALAIWATISGVVLLISLYSAASYTIAKVYPILERRWKEKVEGLLLGDLADSLNRDK